MEISVVGLGKLGLCTAAYFASKGHVVVGVEKNDHVVGELERKRCPVKETGLAELLESSWANLAFTTDLQDAVSRSCVTLIIVPTQSGPDGTFSNEHVEAVLCGIGPALGGKNAFHVVDVVSTVMPGSCEAVFKPLLEDISGKHCGEDFGLVYNPEFIALGSVIENFARPDMVLIGASDEKSARIVKELYLDSCENQPHVALMSLLNAEITKLGLNCFVTMKISFANELTSICERLPGADVDEITQAIGHDSRVGCKYLRGGLGFGGTCFPRDNLAFQVFARRLGYEAQLSRATVAVNEEVLDRLFDLVCKNRWDAERVALLGLSFKQGTHIIEQSQSIGLARRLVGAGCTVSVHDPQALDGAKDVLGDTVAYFSDPYECVCDADSIVLLTRWPEFRELDWERIDSNAKEGAVLLDCWRELKDRQFTKLEYIALGLGVDVGCPSAV
ncbi:MAG: UDP-glucose/GDP-mannose dehydrogenase family protein [Phycisphaerales bacterium]|nr:MAG: UDP-glucose/GDP-mannose dehydrogenase family protein [Phycisphaerales bacterium]